MLPRTATRALPLAALIFLLTAVPALAAPVVSGEFELSGLDSNNKLVEGPDGNEWMTLSSGTADVAKITPAGVVTEFDLGAETPSGIAVAAGKLWITRNGGVTSFEAKDPEGTKDVVGIAAISGASSIVLGPDGNLWVASAENLVRILPTEPETNKPFAEPGLGAKDIDVAGSLLVIASFGTESVVTATPTDPPVTKEVKAGGGLQGVAGGPGGQVAYTQPTVEPKEIGLFTPPSLTPQKLLVPGNDPFGIIFARDDAYWTAEGNGDRLLRITPSGEISDLKGFAAGSRPTQLAQGPGNTLWVALSLAKKVARISGVEPPVPPGLPGPSGSGSSGSGGGQPRPVPETEILSGPGKKIATAGKKIRVSFRFSSPQAGSGFECQLVRPAKKKPKREGKAKASAAATPPPFRACSSPRRYKLGPGRYRFEVRAVLDGVADPSPAHRSFRIVFSP